MKNSEQCRCICQIIPPHVLRHMAATDDPHVRDAARSTTLINRSFDTQRQILSLIAPAGVPTGGMRRTIYDGKDSMSLPGIRVRGEGDPATNDANVSEAYDAAGETYAFYAQIFKRTSVDDRGMRLDSTVHYREDPQEGYDNAFWNGQQMVYGDGDGVLFGPFTKSLDVIAHELTHGVTQFEAALEYHNQSGALNESFSDVFGSMVKQWKLKQTVKVADWLIGKELLLKGVQGKALRSMRNPGTAYDDPRMGRDPQPDRMSAYQHLADNRGGDNGGVHINSGIPNRAFVLACDNLGAEYSWEKAGRVWYATLRALHARSTFVDAATTTVMNAQQLFDVEAAQAVHEAWRTVEVVPDVHPVKPARRSSQRRIRAAKGRGRKR